MKGSPSCIGRCSVVAVLSLFNIHMIISRRQLGNKLIRTHIRRAVSDISIEIHSRSIFARSSANTGGIRAEMEIFRSSIYEQQIGINIVFALLRRFAAAFGAIDSAPDVTVISEKQTALIVYLTALCFCGVVPQNGINEYRGGICRSMQRSAICVR